jgi:hypothetical protein
MNYEEMSDTFVEAAVENQKLKDTGVIKSYDLNNTADWGKLMQDNKISCNWWPATEDDGFEYWGASTHKMWQNANHETKPGRAVSICYLKMKEDNNG